MIVARRHASILCARVYATTLEWADGGAAMGIFYEPRCPQCLHRKLRRSRPRWFEYPLYVVLLQPYTCPHCFTRFYRPWV